MPPTFTLEDYKAKYEYFKEKCKRLQEELTLVNRQLCELKNGSMQQNPERAHHTTVKPDTKSDYDTRPSLPNVSNLKVRGKKRKQLEGHTCDECSRFYEAAGLGADIVQQCTRHRSPKRPKTPPGFWNPAWTSPDKKP